MNNMIFLSDSKPRGPAAGSVPLRRDQALWARIYILKRGRSRLKENPLLGEVPGCKPYVYGDFYPFDMVGGVGFEPTTSTV